MTCRYVHQITCSLCALHRLHSIVSLCWHSVSTKQGLVWRDNPPFFRACNNQVRRVRMHVRRGPTVCVPDVEVHLMTSSIYVYERESERERERESYDAKTGKELCPASFQHCGSGIYHVQGGGSPCMLNVQN